MTYQGIFEGFDDLGRDLLARHGKVIEVVQCKRWAQHRTIHENTSSSAGEFVTTRKVALRIAWRYRGV